MEFVTAEKPGLVACVQADAVAFGVYKEGHVANFLADERAWHNDVAASASDAVGYVLDVRICVQIDQWAIGRRFMEFEAG